ncbi:MAG: hypothetical protein FJY11_01900 [Bacteroidetes bacterium]|nr:hypothetical protein [Bacteroidota bacterium]
MKIQHSILRKILVAAIIIFPLVADSSCKKQPKCGCGKDVILTLSKEPARIYFDVENNTLSFSPILNPYATYYPCNPSDWIPYLSDFTSPAILLVSGEAFYECNYLYNSSNYMYYNPSYRVYQIQISSIEEDLYGKK